MLKLGLSMALFVTGMVFGYLYVVFGIIGFSIGKFAGGDREGARGKMPSIVIPAGSVRLHLHHWLIFGAAMTVLVAEGTYLGLAGELLYGVLGGIAWQGVYCYNDWHRVVYRAESLE